MQLLGILIIGGLSGIFGKYFYDKNETADNWPEKTKESKNKLDKEEKNLKK